MHTLRDARSNGGLNKRPFSSFVRVCHDGLITKVKRVLVLCCSISTFYGIRSRIITYPPYLEKACEMISMRTTQTFEFASDVVAP